LVGNVDFVSFSNFTVQYNRVFSSSASIVEASSLAVNARKKWETEPDVSESWTVVSV
jgi:hypothetical protein